MPYVRVPLLAAALIAITTATASAQALSADEKELSTYRLTMPTLKKVMSALESFMLELSKDPRVQEMKKVKGQIDALEAKDELTEAQEAELEKLRERHEKLEEEVDRATAASGLSNPETIDQMEAAIKQQPAAMRALTREGLTPREYAKCLMALLQASLVEGFSQGKADLSKLPPGVNPENIKFVREHKAELEAMQAAMSKKR